MAKRKTNQPQAKPMTEETKVEEIKEEQASLEIKEVEGVSICNNSAAPITLIANRDRGGKVTILPTQTVAVTGEFMAAIEANEAAMTFFNPKQLVKA